MFDPEKLKQQAKIVLQQLQKFFNDSLRSLELRIKTPVKTAHSLYAEFYTNSVMSLTFIRCLDNEMKTAALKKHDKVDKTYQMDLTRTITNNLKRVCGVKENTIDVNKD